MTVDSVLVNGVCLICLHSAVPGPNVDIELA